MRLSNAQSYAISAVVQLAQVQLAQEPSRRLSCKLICEHANIPERFVMSIMRKLVEAGWVDGKLGAGGGYRLSLPPGEITLLDLLEAVEGRFDSDLNSTVSGVSHEAQQLVDATVVGAVAVLRTQLGMVTIADLAKSGKS